MLVLQGWISIVWKEMPVLFDEMLFKTLQLVDDTDHAVRACVPAMFEIFLDFPEPHNAHQVVITCSDVMQRLLHDKSHLVLESTIRFSKALCKEWPRAAVSIMEALPVSACTHVCTGAFACVRAFACVCAKFVQSCALGQTFSYCDLWIDSAAASCQVAQGFCSEEKAISQGCFGQEKEISTHLEGGFSYAQDTRDQIQRLLVHPLAYACACVCVRARATTCVDANAFFSLQRFLCRPLVLPSLTSTLSLQHLGKTPKSKACSTLPPPTTTKAFALPLTPGGSLRVYSTPAHSSAVLQPRSVSGVYH